MFGSVALYSHIVVQASPPSIFRMLSSSPAESQYPLNTNLPVPALPSPRGNTAFCLSTFDCSKDFM